MKKVMILAVLALASTAAFADEGGSFWYGSNYDQVTGQPLNPSPSTTPVQAASQAQPGDECQMGNVTGHLVPLFGGLVCVGAPDNGAIGTGG